MMTVMTILAFGGALALSVHVLAATLVPNLSRIADVLRGSPQPRFEPLATLVRAERRIAVRRWAVPATRPAYPRREVA